MKAICLNFQIHQPFRLTNFPFFKIGNGKEIFNEELNARILREEAFFYLELNRLLLSFIQNHPGKFNFNFCISGTALEQFETFVPEVLESFRVLHNTGSMELVGTTFSNSLAALVSRREFANQVETHSKKIQELFGVLPETFFISKTTYTEVIGDILFNLGFRQLVFDGEKLNTEKGEINQVFQDPFHEDVSIISINQSLSDYFNLLIGSKNEWNFPTGPENLLSRILSLPENEPLVNISLNYSNLGKYLQNGIQVFGFFEVLVRIAYTRDIGFLKFNSPEIISTKKSQFLPSSFNLNPNPKCNGLKTYLGNDLQKEAFYSLFELEEQIQILGNSSIQKIWTKLQSSDHFFYMNTDYLDDSYPSPIFSPYPSPFQAFINYMNVLANLKVHIEELGSKKETTESGMVPDFRNFLQAVKSNPKSKRNW